MDRTTFVHKINELQLPFGSYVVIGSGILCMLGLRPARDIDIVITSDLVDYFKNDKRWAQDTRWGKIFFSYDVYDVASGLSWGEYPTTTEMAIDTARVIEGIPFLNIDETIAFKKVLGREKDKQDILLLEKYKKHGSI